MTRSATSLQSHTIFSRLLMPPRLDTTIPDVVFLQIIPKIAIAPLFIIWFGFGFAPKLLLVFVLSLDRKSVV